MRVMDYEYYSDVFYFMKKSNKYTAILPRERDEYCGVIMDIKPSLKKYEFAVAF